MATHLTPIDKWIETVADSAGKTIDLTSQIEQAGEDAPAQMQADVDAGKTTWKQIGDNAAKASAEAATQTEKAAAQQKN